MWGGARDTAFGAASGPPALKLQEARGQDRRGRRVLGVCRLPSWVPSCWTCRTHARNLPGLLHRGRHCPLTPRLAPPLPCIYLYLPNRCFWHLSSSPELVTVAGWCPITHQSLSPTEAINRAAVCPPEPVCSGLWGAEAQGPWSLCGVSCRRSSTPAPLE